MGDKILPSLYFLLLQLTLVTGDLVWENCDGDVNTLKLLNLTITPYPIAVPGSISVAIAIHNDQHISSPLKAELTLQRKFLFSYVSVPCVSGIGSCTYEDLCTMCSQCGCPLKEGDHIVTLPITIDTGSWALVGNYQIKVHIVTNSGEQGCVKLTNVHIQSILIVCTSLFLLVQMYTISNNPDEYQRYQRGFGNRRSLATRLKHSKENLFGFDNHDNLRDEKYLFTNPYETLDQNDVNYQQQQQQQPSMTYAQ